MQNVLLESSVKVRQTQPVPHQENQRWLLSKTMAHDCPPSARLMCGWVSPSLQLIKCNGVYQQLEAVSVDVGWVSVVL